MSKRTFKLTEKLESRIRNYDIISAYGPLGNHSERFHDVILNMFLVDLVDYEYHHLSELLAHIELNLRNQVGDYHALFHILGEGRMAYLFIGETINFYGLMYVSIWIKEESDNFIIGFSYGLDAHK